MRKGQRRPHWMVHGVREVLISAHRAVSADPHIGGLAPLLKARGEGFQPRGNIFYQCQALRVISARRIALLRRCRWSAALTSRLIQLIRQKKRCEQQLTHFVDAANCLLGLLCLAVDQSRDVDELGFLAIATGDGIGVSANDQIHHRH